ncbi:MAG: hypothetical protein ACEPO8_05895 [Rhodothermaceae bacterium]
MKKNILLILAVLFVQTLFAGNTKLERKTYLIDFGKEKSSVKENFIGLSKTDIYNSQKGFGWIKAPVGSYERTDLSNSTLRNKMTKDGLLGKDIEFKIDIPKGEWYFTFWMEMGFEDNCTANLTINGKEQQTDFYKFNESAEGRTKIATMYRVYHTKITTDENTFDFRIANKNDSVRIMGVSFIPVENEAGKKYALLDKIIKEAGKYRSKVNLYNLKRKLENLVAQESENSYLQYWKQQVDFLFEAERLIDMMGWEWERYISAASIFDRLHQAICLLNTQLENFDITNYALKERALYLRGKLSFDLNLERGGSHAEQVAHSNWWKLFQKYPDDITLRMFNGEKVDIKDPFDNLVYSENAPRWSRLQREAIGRLSAEVDFWVNDRQAPNGEWGGKIGDDVELLRWWSPFLLTGNKTAIKGWKKLAEAVWNDPKIYKGYSKRPLDVEHASEYISDSTPELLFLDTDSTYYKRLLYTAEYFENLWTIKKSNGDRFVRSAWYSSTEVDERPPRNRDVDYNARAVKPLRYLAWYTRNPKFVKLLEEWSMGWVHTALKTEKGKPIGVLPSSVRGTDGKINGDEKTWYKANMLWRYFDWKYDTGSKILDNIIFTYSLTKNDSLLLPFELQLELIEDNIDEVKNSKTLTEGSKEWAVKHLVKNTRFWEIAEKWRGYADTDEYDDLLLQYGNDYTKYKISGDVKFVESGLEKLLEEVRYNTPLRTNLVQHTDRVRTEGANHLKAMLVGDGTPEGSSPYYAVTWENTNREFTAFVKKSSDEIIVVDVFNHHNESQKITAKFWQLNKGDYELILNIENETAKRKEVKVTKAGTAFELDIPSQKLVTIKLEKR